MTDTVEDIYNFAVRYYEDFIELIKYDYFFEYPVNDFFFDIRQHKIEFMDMSRLYYMFDVFSDKFNECDIEHQMLLIDMMEELDRCIHICEEIAQYGYYDAPRYPLRMYDYM